MTRIRIALAAVLLSGISWLAQAPALAQQKAPAETALDVYVRTPDPAYKYTLIKSVPGTGYTTHIVELISQTWLTEKEVNRTLWKHWLVIVKPDEVASSKALLYISGGNNNSAAPSGANNDLVRVAQATKSVVTELRMIPNQPLIFADDPAQKSRVEDEIIAYTWDKFIKTGDTKWPLRMPMTKAAVRAMDALTEFIGSAAGGGHKLDGFVVMGGSKRGWTTWTTAAVDKRVVAIIPIVIDLLNVIPSFQHHKAVYGYYAPAVGDYEAMGLMEQQDNPRYRELMQLVEPYSYRARFTMPKFIINATGDQFFLPDSWQFYFHELPGTKYLRYVPNADHSLNGSDAWLTALACYNAILYQKPLPQFDWQIDKEGVIRVKSKDKPSEVKLWQASNPGARDFRLSSIGPKWKSTVLTPTADGTYLGQVPKPKYGFTAYFVEMTYPSGLVIAPFKFTTGVKVMPDVEPLKDMK